MSAKAAQVTLGVPSISYLPGEKRRVFLSSSGQATGSRIEERETETRQQRR